jgi:hypothetical protein
MVICLNILIVFLLHRESSFPMPCIALAQLNTDGQYRALLLSMTKTGESTHTAIILARTPSCTVLVHLYSLLKSGVNAFVMSDQRPSMLTAFPSIELSDRVLYVEDTELAHFGLSKNRAWDRAFVWLYNQTSIDFVWIMEDDVTWIDGDDMVGLFDKYTTNRTDLLTKDIIFRSKETLQ